VFEFYVTTDCLIGSLSHSMSCCLSVGPPVRVPWLYHSYEQQQLAEIDSVLSWAANKTNPILMGDFGHGPVTKAETSWSNPLHYGLMCAQGFFSPYAVQDGRCTFCQRMTTVDHIYVPVHMYSQVITATVRAMLYKTNRLM